MIPIDPQTEGFESPFLKIFFQGMHSPSNNFALSRTKRQHQHAEEEEWQNILDEFREKMLIFQESLPVKKIIPIESLESFHQIFEPKISVPSEIHIPYIPEEEKENITVSVGEEERSVEKEEEIIESSLHPLKPLHNAFDEDSTKEEKILNITEECCTTQFRETRGKQDFYEMPHLHIPYFQSYKIQTFPIKRKSRIPTFFKEVPSTLKEFMNVGAIAMGLFIISFVGFNFSSLAVISEKYWNAGEYAEKQVALTNITTETEKNIKTMYTLPVAGVTTQDTKIPFLNLPVAPPDTRIIIPKIAKNIPIITVPESSLRAENWDQLEKDIQDGLRDGVVHYPGTAEPGEEGNVFITGHSSYYPWDSGRYKDVFASLHDLEVGDHYFIYNNGKKYEYVIRERKIVKPNDTSVLQQPEGQKISTLMTCTPVGTTLNRLILKAEQI